MQELWTLQEIIEATNGVVSGNTKNICISSVSIDTRTIEKGALFIALKGENFDAHNFIDQAFNKGADICIVSKEFVNNLSSDDYCLVAVEDTEKALVNLGRYRRENSNAKFIGVTGSVGKTSVKEMLFEALSVHGSTYATKGNLNNHLGTPLSLSRIPKNTKFAVMEMGMSGAREIEFLSNLVQPDISIINNVEAVHLEHFDSIKGIADAKSEIFLGQPENSIAVLNKDNQFFDYLLSKAKANNIAEILAFGGDDQSEFCFLSYNNLNNEVTLENNIDNKIVKYKLGVSGRHQALNSCGVLAIIYALGLDIIKSAKALENYESQSGRGKIITVETDKAKIHIIDDCYNASPVSVKAAIENLLPINEGRVIAILGDMLELGKTSKELHAGLSKIILNSKIDKVYTIGSEMNALYNALPDSKKASNKHYSNIEEAKEDIYKNINEDDTILVKGSNGMKMRILIDYLLEKNKTDNKILAG